MSVFQLSTCLFDTDTIVNIAAWSHGDNICAMATSTMNDDDDQETHHVHFMNTEGLLIDNHLLTHTCPVSTLEWQSSSGKLLAIGWSDGMISIWKIDIDSKPTVIFSSAKEHKSSITVLKWNPSGRRLITGDKSGVIVVWTIDTRGHVTTTRQYKKKGSITALVYCILPKPKSEDSKLTGDSINRTVEQLRQIQSPPFFFGTDKGVICYADDLGNCVEVHTIASSIDCMLYFEETSRLIVITRSMMLLQYQVSVDGKVSRLSQVKLSVTGDITETGIKSPVWAGSGLIAAATLEKTVRIFDVAADEAYSLPLQSVSTFATFEGLDLKTDKVTSVACCPLDRFLAVGTQGGVVAVWRFVGLARTFSASNNIHPTSSDDWQLENATNVQSPVLQCVWSGGRGTLAVITEDAALVLSTRPLHTSMNGPLMVTQRSATELEVFLSSQLLRLKLRQIEAKHADEDVEDENEQMDDIRKWTIDTEMTIKGVCTGKTCFAVWNGKIIQVYRMHPQTHKMEQLKDLVSSGTAIAIADSIDVAEDSVFVGDGHAVKILNFLGVQKGSFSLTESEGCVSHMSMNGPFLAVITNKGVIKVFDMTTPYKPKLMGNGVKFSSPNTGLEVGSSSMVTFGQDVLSYLAVKCARINSDGSRVALLMESVQGMLQTRHPHNFLYVHDRLKGNISEYDFSNHGNAYPTAIAWDDSDNRILCCETVQNKSAVSKTSGNTKNTLVSEGDNAITAHGLHETESCGNVSEVFVLFVTSEHGILVQDSFVKLPQYGPLVGISVPKMYFTVSNTNAAVDDDDDDDSQEKSSKAKYELLPVIMRDFVNMDRVNQETKIALLDFSLNVTLGKHDEAYRAVRSISNPTLWANMARMCIKTKRMDVAEICLSQMGHARGAAALREAKKENSVEVSAGILAVQLGFYDDAMQLFKEANRNDLICSLLQASGKFERAIKIASGTDPVAIPDAHLQCARHLESIGCVDEAIEHYELGHTAATDIPRMLLQAGRLDQLESYINGSDNTELNRRWGQQMEGDQKLDKAINHYKKAGDFHDCVRICCLQGDFSRAVDLVRESEDKAAAYNLAKFFEDKGDIDAAVGLYADAGCLNHVIRLCKTHKLDADLMSYALRSPVNLILDCALYFEQRGDIEKAVQLYHKGGDLARALELCFTKENAGSAEISLSGGVAELMNAVIGDLGEKTSASVLTRCASFLIKFKQFERAVNVLVLAKQYDEAIELCLKNKVAISENMVEKLTAQEGVDSSTKKDLCKRLAKVLTEQGSYSAASKLYTQIGDRIRAMKCLVLSGDTKAVTQFASISRSSDVYILAANYLQQMNWRDDVDIMKSVISFYGKAKAFDQLATFFDSCAQVEIDEFRDYDKALGALREGLRQLASSSSVAAPNLRDNLERKVQLVERFIHARDIEKEKPEQMVEICEMLLKEPQLDEAVRAGDCLALLVEHFYDLGESLTALCYIREMRARKITVSTYIDADILDDILKETKQVGTVSDTSVPSGESDDDDGVGEEIEQASESDDDDALEGRHTRK